MGGGAVGLADMNFNNTHELQKSKQQTVRIPKINKFCRRIPIIRVLYVTDFLMILLFPSLVLVT